MPNLNDFYAFNSSSRTNSDGGDNGDKNSSGNSGLTGCGTVLIESAVIGWVLWLVGR